MYSIRQPPRISAAPTKADNLRTLIGILSESQSHELNLKFNDINTFESHTYIGNAVFWVMPQCSLAGGYTTSASKFKI
jgi:hypothetical protein